MNAKEELTDEEKDRCWFVSYLSWMSHRVERKGQIDSGARVNDSNSVSGTNTPVKTYHLFRDE